MTGGGGGGGETFAGQKLEIDFGEMLIIWHM